MRELEEGSERWRSLRPTNNLRDFRNEPEIAVFAESSVEEDITRGGVHHVEDLEVLSEENRTQEVVWVSFPPAPVKLMRRKLKTPVAPISFRYRSRAGLVFSHQAPPLHWAGRGIFRVIPAPPLPGAHLYRFPRRGPICNHPALADTRLGYGWGGGWRGDRGREC